MIRNHVAITLVVQYGGTTNANDSKNNPTVGDSVKLKHPYAYLVPFDGIRPLRNVAHGGL